MFKEYFRTKCNKTDYKSVMAAVEKYTGESDFFGFLETDDPEAEFKKAINAGFIEFDSGHVIVNADGDV